MAQAHRARTREGEEVMVEVQRPGVDQLRADLSVLHWLACSRRWSKRSPCTAPPASSRSSNRAVHEELDFLNEAANVRAFSRATGATDNQNSRVFDELTADRTVLTLEFLPGPKLSNASLDQAGSQRMATIILENAFEQLFEDGLFHSNPHPGNLLVQPGRCWR